MRRGGVEVEVTVGKRAARPLGLRLNASIFDRVQTCDNHCEFCFIYQLPPGMRKSLYLKDDDYRLSFLYGNFTTLTRFTELDLARVVEEKLGPLYVSIHATDPVVRTRMLRNPKGATSLRWLRGLLERGVVVHGQIVLCPGINDGEVLARTCAEILGRYPRLATVGVVPLGLSRYNTEANLVVHSPAGAGADLDVVHTWQQRALEMVGRRMFFASDELYLVAGRPIPSTEEYEDYSQHENGIGMVRAFYDELDRIETGSRYDVPVVTGEWRTIPAAPALGYRAPRHVTDDPAAPAGPAVVLTGRYGVSALEPGAVPTGGDLRPADPAARGGQRLLRRQCRGGGVDGRRRRAPRHRRRPRPGRRLPAPRRRPPGRRVPRQRSPGRRGHRRPGAGPGGAGDRGRAARRAGGMTPLLNFERVTPSGVFNRSKLRGRRHVPRQL